MSLSFVIQTGKVSSERRASQTHSQWMREATPNDFSLLKFGSWFIYPTSLSFQWCMKLQAEGRDPVYKKIQFKHFHLAFITINLNSVCKNAIKEQEHRPTFHSISRPSSKISWNRKSTFYYELNNYILNVIYSHYFRLRAFRPTWYRGSARTLLTLWVCEHYPQPLPHTFWLNVSSPFYERKHDKNHLWSLYSESNNRNCERETYML